MKINKKDRKRNIMYTVIFFVLCVSALASIIIAKDGLFGGAHIGEVEHDGYVCKDTVIVCQEAMNGTEICDYYCDTENYEEIQDD